MALDFLNTQANIKEKEVDSLGGGSFIWNTGLYPVIIDSAYLDFSSGGAANVNFVFKTPEGKSLNQTIYVSNKDGNNFYIDKKTMESKYLPGFELVNEISLCAINLPIGETETEEKTVEVYNAELKKKAPANKQVFMDLIGKVVQLGVIKGIEFKQAKNAIGVYEDTTDTREFNEIHKVFDENGRTAVELRADADPEFLTKWTEMFKTDFIKDKRKGVTGASKATAGLPTNGASVTPKKSLFNK